MRVWSLKTSSQDKLKKRALKSISRRNQRSTKFFFPIRFSRTASFLSQRWKFPTLKKSSSSLYLQNQRLQPRIWCNLSVQFSSNLYYSTSGGTKLWSIKAQQSEWLDSSPPTTISSYNWAPEARSKVWGVCKRAKRLRFWLWSPLSWCRPLTSSTPSPANARDSCNSSLSLRKETMWAIPWWWAILFMKSSKNCSKPKSTQSKTSPRFRRSKQLLMRRYLKNCIIFTFYKCPKLLFTLTVTGLSKISRSG